MNNVGERVALVIGNSKYRSGPPLANPATDAVAIAGAFERLGFSDVTRRFDLDKAGHDQALRRFTAIAKTADIAVIYFAGHGMEMDGENYLLPIDAELGDASSLGFEATRLSDVMRAVEGARKFRLVILDACRDNPFRGRMSVGEATRSIASAPGLAAVEPPGNTLVAYAARHGTTAKDSANGQLNSPYAAALLNRLETPNMDIRLVLGHVRDDVMAATNHQQQPFFYGTLGGAEIALKRVDAAPGDEITREQHRALLRALEEERDWERALRADTADAYAAFRATYPSGRFTEQAKTKLEDKAGAVVAEDEKRDWAAAVKGGLSVDFRDFLAKWPGGRLAADAKARMTEALAREEGYEFKAVQQAHAAMSPNIACPDPASLRAFIARYGGSGRAGEARAMLAKLEETHGARFDLTERRQDGLLYLERFPHGARAADIKAFLDGAGDDRAWIRVLATRDRPFSSRKRRAAIEGYMADWPSGRHIKEAQGLAKKFKWRKYKIIGALLALLAVYVALVLSQQRSSSYDYSTPSYTPTYQATDPVPADASSGTSTTPETPATEYNPYEGQPAQ